MLRPRIKREHAPYRTDAGTIRIGGELPGVASEINDPQGWIWSLISAIDGSRGPDELIAHVRDAFPDLPRPAVLRALDGLVAAGHIEDAADDKHASFTAREHERYKRNIEFYRWVDLTARPSAWHIQQTLKDARVIVIGLGGIGGTTATALAASGIGRLHCIDPDTVEISNLSRQVLYTEDDLGKPKAKAAIARLRRLNSDISITGEQRAVETENDCVRVIQGFDVLVLAADQPRHLRLAVNRACLRAGVPWVDGGYYGPVITIKTFVPNVGPCWECARVSEFSVAHRPAPHSTALMHVMGPVGHPVTAASAGLSGNLIAHVTIAILTNTLPFTPGSTLSMNLLALEDPIMVERPARLPHCAACGTPATSSRPIPTSQHEDDG